MPEPVVYARPDGGPFEVEWPDPAMAEHEWRWDQVKNPLPLTPLAREFMETKREGMSRAAEQTGRPSNSSRIYVNGYAFARSIPTNPADAPRFAQIAEKDTAARIDLLLDLWNSTYQPEIESLVHQLRTWAAPKDSLENLTERWDEVKDLSRRLGELHTFSTGLINIGLRQFQDLCQTEFGDEGPQLAIDLVAGMPNMSVKSAAALWNLSRTALDMPAVAQLLHTTQPSDFLADLASVQQGPGFADLLTAHLAEYGNRNESFFEISDPTWREDPSFVIAILRRYIDSPADHDPTAMHKRAAATREKRTKEAISRLSDPSKIDRFLAAQKRARQHTILMEDHNFYIDQLGHSSLRIPCLEIGTRLAQRNAIETPADVFYLHSNEFAPAASTNLDARSLVTARRTERTNWTGVFPPPFIGGNAQRLDLNPSIPATPPNGIIKGQPASTGIVQGTARIILTLEDAPKLTEGDILVTYATAPSWTPLFALASAIVTDAGGPLSHCAILAREYGIPAVVGAANATTHIPDGATITVDGSAGTVHIEA